MNKQDFVLEEYKSLREEIMIRQARAAKVMTSGLFGIPALVAAGRLVELEFDLGETLFLLAPIVLIISCFVYVAEHNGMMRAGIYIRNHIEPLFMENDKGWENWLVSNESNNSRSVDNAMNFSFFAVVTLYFLGSMMTFYKFADPLFGDPRWNTFILFLFPFLGAIAIFTALNDARHGHKVWYEKKPSKPARKVTKK